MDDSTRAAIWYSLLPTWAIVLLMLPYFCFVIRNAADPPDPLRIARETTLVTGPIAEDGLPDFATALLDSQRSGVTAHNNGAVLFWQAMGPDAIEPDQRAAFFAELGMGVPWSWGTLLPLRSERLESQLADWLAAEAAPNPDARAMRFLDLAPRRPWEPAECPPLARWAAVNEDPLDLLVEASSREHFYSPSPSLLLDPPPPLVASLLPGVEGARTAARSLGARAMYRVSRGDSEAALGDIRAVLDLARHLEKRPHLVTQVVGFALRIQAHEAMLVWLGVTSDRDAILNCVESLLSQPEPQGARRGLVFGDSLMMIDSVLGMFYESRPAPDRDLSPYKNYVDVNDILMFVRRWQDRVADVAAIGDRVARRRECRRLDVELDAIQQRFRSPLEMGFAVFSRRARSRQIGRIFVSMLTPACESAFEAEDRSVATRRMTIISAKLRLHRLEHGKYPETLDALTPNPLEAILLDPFSNKPFLYERRGRGFLIYSVGPNGIDENACDAKGDFVDGEHAATDWLGER